jgi:hypothetical protein
MPALDGEMAGRPKTIGSSKLPIVRSIPVASPSASSKVSGVPQAEVGDRRRWIASGLARRPRHVSAGHIFQSNRHAALGALAHKLNSKHVALCSKVYVVAENVLKAILSWRCGSLAGRAERLLWGRLQSGSLCIACPLADPSLRRFHVQESAHAGPLCACARKPVLAMLSRITGGPHNRAG